MLRPLNDSLVVEPLKSEATSVGGIVLPDGSAQQKYHGMRALVVAVGPGLWTLSGTRLPLEPRAGQVVILRHAGPLIRHSGRIFSIVSERDVLAVIEGPEAEASRSRRYSEDEHGGALAANVPDAEDED